MTKKKQISVASGKAKGRRCFRCKVEFTPEDNERLCSCCRTHCSTCGVTLTEGNWDVTGRLLRNQYRCKLCVAEGVRNSRGNAGFCQESYDLRRHYGISKEERDNLFKNGCEICGTTEKLCVDHDHQSGEVRGCLCNKCNIALGMFDDNRKKIKKAKRYLNRFKKK